MRNESGSRKDVASSLETSPEWLRTGYKVLRKIGSGGQGTVFLAQQAAPDGNKVAVKVWNDGSNYKAFQREVLNLRNIRHSNIVGFLDCLRLPGDGCALIMEYIGGRSLDELMKSLNQPMEWEANTNTSNAAPIFHGILQGLSALHSLNPPLVHRDVKPSNIMISFEQRVVLVDFGLSKRQLSGQTLTESMQNVCGTPAYLSPEAVMGLDDLDERIDVWAAGVVLHEMLCGKPLFRAQNLFALGQQIGTFEFKPLKCLTEEVNNFVRKLLLVDRSARFCNAIECSTTLDKILKKTNKQDNVDGPTAYIEPIIFFVCVRRLLVELPIVLRMVFLRHWQQCEGQPWTDSQDSGSRYLGKEANSKQWPRWVQDALRAGDSSKWDLIIFNSILLWSSVHPLADPSEDRTDLQQFYEWRKLLALSTDASWRSFTFGNILDKELNTCVQTVRRFSSRHGYDLDGSNTNVLPDSEKAKLNVVIELDRQLLRMPIHSGTEGLLMLETIHRERIALLPEDLSGNLTAVENSHASPSDSELPPARVEDEVMHHILNRFPRNHVVSESPRNGKPASGAEPQQRPSQAQSSPLRPTFAKDAKGVRDTGPPSPARVGVVGLRREVVQGQVRMVGVVGLRTGAVLGSKGSGDGQLKNPHGVAVNVDNRIVVADNGNNRILFFGVDGRMTRCLGREGSGPGEFRGPCGMAVDGDGRLIVVDGGNHRVQILAADGSVVQCFGSLGGGEGDLKEPRGVAVDSQGRIIVADWGNHRVQVFADDGRHVLTVGSEGSGEGQLKSPYGVAVDSEGMIVVADTSNHRVQVFDPAGRAVHSFGAFGAGAGQLKYPNAVAVDGEGRIVVCDNWNHRVQVFDKGGQPVRCLGSKGAGTAQLSYPSGVAIDGEGRIVVSDTANHRLQVF